jgi:hypothetical protein
MATLMRTFVSVVLGLVFLAILGAIGVGIYNAGVAAGLAQTGAAAGTVAPYVYGYGFHGGFGFGFLGLLFPILFLFLIFGLIRAAIFGGRRGWGGHGWQGGTGPDSWRAERDRAMADLHRRLHESEGTDPVTGRATPSGGSSTGSTSAGGSSGSGR